MNINPWITFALQILTLGFIFWVIYKFINSIIISLKNSFFTIRHIDRKATWQQKLIFNANNLLNQLISYLLLAILLFLFPAIFIFIESFFNQVICGGKSISQFMNHLPSIIGTMASFYSKIIFKAEPFIHRLTS